jgi:LacI family transcriptional regulator
VDSRSSAARDAGDRDKGRLLADLHGYRQVDALLVIAPDLINYRSVEVMSTIPTILVNCLDRLAGIEAAAEHTSVSVQAVANRDIGSGFDAARTLLNAPGAPTALICTHERMAVGARLAAADLGLTIPADLSLVGLDDGELLASSLVPPLTTIDRPDRAMAEQAVTMTPRRFDEDSEGQISQYSFSCRAAIRDSVARPRRPQRPPCRPADRR